MTTNTYVSLATITLTSTDSEIVFSSIPATYRDLIVVSNFRMTSPAIIRYRFNADAGNNYSSVRMYFEGIGNAIGSDSGTGDNLFRNWTIQGTSNPNTIIVNVQDYSVTDKQKTALARLNDITNNAVAAFAGRWANTSAVSSIQISTATNAFAIGSTFSLYGVN